LYTYKKSVFSYDKFHLNECYQYFFFFQKMMNYYGGPGADKSGLYPGASYPGASFGAIEGVACGIGCNVEYGKVDPCGVE
jgi:hypothetical protein